jgi:predicted  nucleic acid-binding Zn-ribbon protein
MRIPVCISIFALALALGGCATSSDVEALNERIAALEARSESDAERIAALEQRMDARLSALESRMNDVAVSADRSIEQARDAEARARAAETNASDAARKADAIFRKSVSK